MVTISKGSDETRHISVGTTWEAPIAPLFVTAA